MDSGGHTKSQHKGLPGYSPENLQPWMLTVNFSITGVATLILLLRIASRRIRQQRLWWDDYTIIFSLVWLYGIHMLNFGVFYQGVGRHVDVLSSEQYVLAVKWLLVCGVAYPWNLCWTKLSVLLMYYRIFDFAPFRRMAFWVAGFVILWAICASLLTIFVCVPFAKIWHPELPGHCMSQIAAWITNGVGNIVADIVILLMPITQIWKLQLKTEEKMGLTFVMGLGCFVICASFYRLFVLMTFDHADATYTLGPSIAWSVIEIAVSIISACLPTQLPVLRFCASKLGIQFPFLSTMRGGGGGAAAPLNGAAGGQGLNGTGDVPHNPLVTVGQQSTRRPSYNAFYRLSDEEGSESFQNGHRRVDGGGARPEGHSPDSIAMHTLPLEVKTESPVSP
ncbi:hypothetical protein ESCO_003405 [Escovopsis weberi]|uniref:Rhodopsin domain-containing protein n=1 Tax=Escovopsis weberi TaxID=150374 RepID=A0A0M8N0Y9_ESCWE|nr:hypothetical protein ESCO_003405 [Escovopsis weberi]